MSEEPGEFERKSRAAFDASVSSLDAGTRSRLARARETALARVERPRLSRTAIWVPAAAASALVAAVVWRTHDPGQPQVEVAQVPGDELQFLPAEDLGILQEDEGFYAWAAEQMSDGVG
jgi:hypothetical protein